MNADAVADQLHQAGFLTKVVASNAVLVSLTSRKVNVAEVETALARFFEGNRFECRAPKAVYWSIFLNWD